MDIITIALFSLKLWLNSAQLTHAAQPEVIIELTPKRAKTLLTYIDL